MTSTMSDLQSPAPFLPPPPRPAPADPAHTPTVSRSVFADMVAPESSPGAPAAALPEVPVLPTLPPVVPVVPVVAAEPAVVVAPAAFDPRVAASAARRRRQAPRWHAPVRALIVLGLLGGVAAAGWFALGQRSGPALPDFDADRPDYATVDLATSYREPESPEQVNTQLVVSADGDVWRAATTIETSDTVILLESVGGTAWVQAGDEWVAVGVPRSPRRLLHATGRVTMYRDVVPVDARGFVELVSVEAADANGPPRQRITIDVAARRLEAEAPEVYRAWSWAAPDDVAVPEIMRFELDVDDRGLVHRLHVDEALGLSDLTVELTEVTDSPFTIEPPRVYYELDSGLMYVDGEAVDCASQQRTLEVVVEAYAAATGLAPVSEAETIPDYLREELVGYDIVDGAVVPVAGICG